jgi:hypothetical protein
MFKALKESKTYFRLKILIQLFLVIVTSLGQKHFGDYNEL